jgi:two-component system cell cycle response regulator
MTWVAVEVDKPRILLIDVSDASREVMARRLSAQGYSVETAADPVAGADLALATPPAAVIADLWMPSISGVQLCRLLRAEPATVDVAVVLRGDSDDPRSRFWAERAGAAAYVRKGCTGELVRVLTKAITTNGTDDGFFTQLASGVDIRDRIARCLDSALFDSVIASEVRALTSCGSFERLFDLLAQFLAQVLSYRWVAVVTNSPPQFAIHHHPSQAEAAEAEARVRLGVAAEAPAIVVSDEDASPRRAEAAVIVAEIPFGGVVLGKLAVAPADSNGDDTAHVVRLVASELGSAVRMAALIDEQQRMAAIDALTGLRNRRSFVEAMNVEVARASRYELPLCLLMMDVDHFKAINDGRGHAGGDQVLVALGALLRQQLRMPDLAARWGGEEFVVALPNTDRAGGEVVGERLRRSIRELEVRYEGAPIAVSVSIGLAELGRSEALSSVIDRADRAMYGAKVGGRNRVVVAESHTVEQPVVKSA